MKALKSEVAAKYTLMGIRPGKYNFKGFGEIDLCALSVARADDLFRRGFQFLKLRNAEAGASAPPANPKVFPINKGAAGGETAHVHDMEKLRKNKKFINSLLALAWIELSEQDRKVFFDDENLFQEKKVMLNRVSTIDREMQTLHASVKLLASDDAKLNERGEIMNRLSELEEEKLELFGNIDVWGPRNPAGNDPDNVAAKAAEEAIKKQKLIEAHENYIYRNEPALKNMPESTPAEKKKKAAKAAEIERRKEELIKMGKPYNRKSKNA